MKGNGKLEWLRGMEPLSIIMEVRILGNGRTI